MKKRLIFIVAILMMVSVGCGDSTRVSTSLDIVDSSVIDKADIESDKENFSDSWVRELENEKGKLSVETCVFKEEETWSVKLVEWITKEGSTETFLFEAPTEFGSQGVIEETSLLLQDDSSDSFFEVVQIGYDDTYSYENFVNGSTKEYWTSNVSNFLYEENGYYELSIENGVLSVMFKISNEENLEGYQYCIIDKEHKIANVFYYLENVEIFDDSRAKRICSSIDYWNDNTNNVIDDAVVKTVNGFPYVIFKEMCEMEIGSEYQDVYEDGSSLTTYVYEKDENRSMKVASGVAGNGKKVWVICEAPTDLGNMSFHEEGILLYDNDENYYLIASRGDYESYLYETGVNLLKEQWISSIGYEQYPYEENGYYALWVYEDLGLIDVIFKVSADGYEGYSRYVLNSNQECVMQYVYVEKSELFDNSRALRTIKSIPQENLETYEQSEN